MTNGNIDRIRELTETPVNGIDLARFCQSIPIPLCITSHQGCLIVNQAWENTFGVERSFNDIFGYIDHSANAVAVTFICQALLIDNTTATVKLLIMPFNDFYYVCVTVMEKEAK